MTETCRDCQHYTKDPNGPDGECNALGQTEIKGPDEQCRNGRFTPKIKENKDGKNESKNESYKRREA